MSDADDNPNLEYEPDFLALEQAAQPRPKPMVGDQGDASDEPDWDQLLASSEELMARTQDLRIDRFWTVAALRRRGFAGLAEGLGRMAERLAVAWDSVHPRIDPEDDDDPTQRLNAFAFLEDQANFVRYLRDAPFHVDPQMGPLSYRTLALARRELPSPEGEEPLQESQVGAACAGDPAALIDTHAVVGACVAHLDAIGEAFSNRIGMAPEIGASRELLAKIHHFLGAHLPADEASVDTASGEAEPFGSEADDAPMAAPEPRVPGTIAGPDDILRLIDEMCSYYARAEPSSPIPVLLGRARRLVGRSFLEILQDLTPAGIDQIRVFQGEAQ